MKPDPMQPPPTEVPECTPQVPLTLGCVECSCSRTPECAPAVSDCDEDCWSLLRCAYDRCLATLDEACLEAACPEHGASMDAALAMLPCTTGCYGFCVQDLRRPVMEETDAGVGADELP